jgi:fructokinase
VSLRIGIDLGGTKIEGIVLDASREVVRVRVDTPRGDYEATLVALASLVDQLDPGGDAPVGIGIPGTISASTGLVKNANSTWLIGRRFQHDVEVIARRPVRIANDANCFAMSEAADGAASGAQVVFGVIVGTGVGGGIVVNGRIVSGANGIAGEWGHNPLPWPDADDEGPQCYCGKRGCIETFLSGPGITADHERVTGVRMLAPQIVEAAAHGEAAAEQTLRRYERRMARALASIVNVLDPDVIVLGGGISNIKRLYTNVPRLWGRFVFAAVGGSQEPSDFRMPNPKSRLGTRLVPARHGAASGVRGAAWLWPDVHQHGVTAS